MKSSDKDLILRILRYTRDIRSYIAGNDSNTFMQDAKTISACAFTLGQIGELVKFVEASFQKKHPEIPWKSMKGLRNRIVHEYENVDRTVLWGIVSKSIPELEEQLEEILTRESGTE